MTSRERVFRTLEFRGPDRAPRQLWSLAWVSQFAKAELDAVNQRFRGDFGAIGGLARGDRARGQSARKGVAVDDWGCPFTAAEDGVVGEVLDPPLADWAALTNFCPPWEILRNSNWDDSIIACEKNLTVGQRFIHGGTTIRPFERMQFLRGSQNLYYDLGEESANLFRLRDMVHEFYLAELALWVKTPADGLVFMDDWGAQDALLISPAQWRRVFKPLYKDYCDLMKSAGKKIFFHSDGHIMAILPDLIELGVDAVNAQLFCMDIEEIGRRFKGRITFWGEIDRQWILPFGTPADVRAAVARVRRALDDGRGGLIAQCEWGVRNPRANIEAVFEAWEEPREAVSR